MKKLYVVAGLLAFIAALIVLAPANTVYGWARSSIPVQVKLYAVGGRLLRGHADQARVEGVAVHDLHWHLHPTALLTGKIVLNLTARLAGGRTSALVRLDTGNDIELENVVTTATLAGIEPLLQMEGLPAKAHIGLRLKRARIDDGRLVSATGRLTAGDVAWNLSEPAVALGAYRADIETRQKDIVADLRDTQAPIAFNGHVALTSGSTWHAHFRLRARADAPADVKNLLANLGEPGPGGWHDINQHGHL
jgi:general secretion pathway protein N